MIRSLLIASAIVLGTVSAQAAGLDSIERQAGVYEGLAGGHPVAGATMHYEGRAATATEAPATIHGYPESFYQRYNESIFGN